MIPGRLRRPVGDDSRQSEDEVGSDRPTGQQRSTGRQRVPGRALTADDVFEVLDSSRRRYLLSALRERSEWQLDDLAGRVAARETDAPDRASDEKITERVYASLYRVHVPLLADRGVVSFDPATERVVAGDRFAPMVAALVAVGEALDAAAETTGGDGEDPDGPTGLPRPTTAGGGRADGR